MQANILQIILIPSKQCNKKSVIALNGKTCSVYVFALAFMDQKCSAGATRTPPIKNMRKHRSASKDPSSMISWQKASPPATIKAEDKPFVTTASVFAKCVCVQNNLLKCLFFS